MASSESGEGGVRMRRDLNVYEAIGLTPRDSRVSQRVTRITITGQAAHPRCMTTIAPDGSVTVMLMEEAASIPVAPDADRAGLEKACH